MRILIDTNVLIYDSISDSVNHQEARKILDANSPWLIPTIVLYEFIWFMKSKNIDIERTGRLLDNYLEDPRSKVISDRGGCTRTALQYLRERGEALSRFNDMVILSSLEEGAGLATFDQKLREEANEKDTPLVPTDI